MDININVPEGWNIPESESFEETPEPDQPGEKWKQWKDSPYQVSDMGRVRRVQENGEVKMRKPRDDDRGKFRVNLTWVKDGRPYREEPFLHQMVMALFGPEKPSGENIVVCHKQPTGSDNKPNNKLSNLYWCDRSRNVQDAHDDGLIEDGKKWGE